MLDMSPVFTMDNTVDCNGGHAIFNSEMLLFSAFSGVTTADFQYLLSGQFCHRMTFPKESNLWMERCRTAIPFSGSSFVNHLATIFSWRVCAEMFRVNTGTITDVSGRVEFRAKMNDKQSFRDRPIHQFVGDDMRPNILSVTKNSAVPSVKLGPSVKVASIRTSSRFGIFTKSCLKSAQSIVIAGARAIFSGLNFPQDNRKYLAAVLTRLGYSSILSRHRDSPTQNRGVSASVLQHAGPKLDFNYSTSLVTA